MRVLVTGGAGFIGSNIADALVEAGHEVVILDDLSSGKRENVPSAARLEVMDIRSPEAAELVLSVKPTPWCTRRPRSTYAARWPTRATTPT